MAAGTIEYPDIQRHLLPVSAPAACLTRIGRIDFHQLAASFFRFARQLTEKCLPSGICNAFRQTMVVDHAVHCQILNSNHAKAIDNLTALLVSEILSTPRDTLMDTGHNFPMLTPPVCALSKLGVLPLHPGKGLLFLTKKPGVLYFSSIRQGSKGLESHINADLGRCFWQTFR